jgi:hypothetical protein
LHHQLNVSITDEITTIGAQGEGGERRNLQIVPHTIAIVKPRALRYQNPWIAKHARENEKSARKILLGIREGR